MATTQNTIAPPDDKLQTSNPPGVNGGLANSISPATPPPAPTAPTYTTSPVTATTYTATPYTVPENATVQERVRGLVAEDSPLMQQAGQRARQEMAQRGLINSNLAIGAGHQAVIAQALPIAQQDAQTYANAATNTFNQQNAAAQFNAGSQNTVALNNAQQANAALANNQQAAVQLINTKLTADTQVTMANLDSQTRLALTTLDAQSRHLLQTNQSASQLFSQTAASLAAIGANDRLSGLAKNNATNTQLNLLRQQLAALNHIATTTPAEVKNLNLTQFFKPPAPKPKPAPAAPTPMNPRRNIPSRRVR